MKITLPDFFLLFVFGDNRADTHQFIEDNFHESDVLKMASTSAGNTSILESILLQRLRQRISTVFDASALSSSCRLRFKKLAKKYHTPVHCLFAPFENTSRLQHDKFTKELKNEGFRDVSTCLLYTSPSPRDRG